MRREVGENGGTREATLTTANLRIGAQGELPAPDVLLVEALGLRRAQAVVNFFASRGISRSRLEAVASFGETQPVVMTQGRERRNRRTVTEVSGFVASHPIIMDGKYAEVVYREYVESATSPTTLQIVGNELAGAAE